MRAFTLPCLMLSIFAFPACATETPFPLYDVDQACRRSGLDQSACVDYVQPFYDQLRYAWPEISEAVKRECVQRYPDNIHARYVQIFGCTVAETRKEDLARQAVSPNRFRY